jgi:signal transduction histidine kinase
MKLQHKFILFFSSYVLLVCVIIAGISLVFLSSTYATFTHAPNPALIKVMADRMLLKAMLSFSVISAVVIAISIMAGIFISRLISGSYLAFFRDIIAIARTRVPPAGETSFSANERAILQSYLTALLADQERLHEYEKIKSWKDGARLLMHELKNPLTPLKLAAQSLMVGSGDAARAERNIQRILVATNDVENILACFKELVNIEFGPKANFRLREFLQESFDQLSATGILFDIKGVPAIDPAVEVCAHPTLLRMVFNNLITNAIEANPSGVSIDIAQIKDRVAISVTTAGRSIDNIPQVFRLGYSQKGAGRGMGLFICKMIAEYLDLRLTCRNEPQGVVFSVECTIIQGAGHAEYLPR